jgi:hypothetical protein
VYLLRGIIGYVSLLVGLAAIAHAGAVLSARALGVAPFRWFDGLPPRGALWRRIGVRVSSTLLPLLATLALLFFGALARGSTLPTTTVEVQPGPAQLAGIRTGDRILSVGGKPVGSWDALRAEVKQGFGERLIEVERRGQKLVFKVTPRDGRISVSPVYEHGELSVREALAHALQTPRVVLGGVLERAFREHEDRVTLMGPVAIVRQTEAQPDSSSFLVFLGLIGCYFWPIVAGVHVFDALTLALFRVTHPWVLDAKAERRSIQLARFWQAILLSLMAVPLLVLLELVQESSFGDGALLGILLLMPVAAACAPLVGFAAFERWGKERAAAAIAASVLVPCAVLGMAAWLLAWMRGELARQGFRVSWFVTARETSLENGRS